jgi:LacI family transcriptional regulator
MAVTIADVAQKAGVSKTTVSRILSNTAGFKYSAKTKEKVEKAVHELGYNPSPAAQMMRFKELNMIGIATQPTNSVFSIKLLEAVYKAIKAQGYSPAMIDLNETNDLYNSCHLHRLEFFRGIICAYSAQAKFARDFSQKVGHNLEIISLGSNIEPGGKVRVVTSDFIAGIHSSVKHLAELGHKNIAFLGQGEASELRRNGFWESIKEFDLHGEEFISGLALNTVQNTQMAHDFAATITKNKSITAIVCQSDQAAIGLICGLSKLGIRVPDDISVVGFDDLPISQFLVPPLTTVRQEVEDIADKAAKLLISSIESKEINKEMLPYKILVKPELIVRNSTMKI